MKKREISESNLIFSPNKIINNLQPSPMTINIHSTTKQPKTYTTPPPLSDILLINFF